MIRSRFFVSFILLLLLILALLALHSQYERKVWIGEELPASKELVGRLALTDLSLWTEARYTRHPAMADFFTPFQDSPASFEHFPAGSIIAPRLPAAGSRLQVRQLSTDFSR